MRRTILTVAAALLVASPVLAGDIERHENNQDQRIENGVESGRITPKEAQRLENEQETIKDERARALEDGRITHKEHREIRHDQKKANRDIHKKKHNEHGKN